MLDVNIFFGQVALRFSASQWSVATVERSLRAICAQKYVEIPKSTRPKKRNVALSKLLQFPITLKCLRLKEKMANVLRKLTSFLLKWVKSRNGRLNETKTIKHFRTKLSQRTALDGISRVADQGLLDCMEPSLSGAAGYETIHC